MRFLTPWRKTNRSNSKGNCVEIALVERMADSAIFVDPEL